MIKNRAFQPFLSVDTLHYALKKGEPTKLWFLKRSRLEEPCDGCAAPYGYHNIMPLTTDVQYFAVSLAQGFQRSSI